MANLQVTPSAAFAEYNELNFQGLYLYHTFSGDNPNQVQILDNESWIGMGAVAINNWTVYDGIGPNARLVAHAKGLHVNAGKWHNSFSLVFEDERFSGSTLEVMGIVVGDSGEWAVVGGTGQFAMANGVISKRLHEAGSDEDVIELTIRAFCPVINGPRVSTAVKVGPWGGSGGSPLYLTEASKHLESITIYTGITVVSIAFSYVDYAGQKHSAGPWDGSGGNPETIQLTESEVLTEVSGTIGNVNGLTAITSIKFVTNLKTYGPFGAWGDARDNSFTVPVPPGSGIVGFFARAEDYLDALGVYVRSLWLFESIKASKHLESITIYTGITVVSIAFSYVDYAGQKHSTGPWGGTGGNYKTIQLTESEVLTEVSGTIGNSHDLTLITSIKFVTNLKTYGPWGRETDTSFTIPVQQGSAIVGFFARAGQFLDAIGVYVRPL